MSLINHCLSYDLFSKLSTTVNFAGVDTAIGLNSTVKIFIGIVALLGPLSIAGIIIILRKIEKNYPSLIRWR